MILGIIGYMKPADSLKSSFYIGIVVTILGCLSSYLYSTGYFSELEKGKADDPAAGKDSEKTSFESGKGGKKGD